MIASVPRRRASKGVANQAFPPRAVAETGDAGPHAPSGRALDPTSAGEDWVHPGRLAGGWRLAGGAMALLLLSALAVQGIAPWRERVQGGRQAVTAAAQSVDPLLIVRPRLLTQVTTVGGLRLALTVSPLIPGPNRLELRLSTRSPLAPAARVRAAAVMAEMAMPPVQLAMREVRRGQYTAVGPLTMFGLWGLTVHIERPGATPLTHRFTIAMTLPPALLAAGTRGAQHQ